MRGPQSPMQVSLVSIRSPPKSDNLISFSVNSETNHERYRSIRSTQTYVSCEPTLPTFPRTCSVYSGRTQTLNRAAEGALGSGGHEPAPRVASLRRETKTAQTLSVVVGGFVACWLPFFILYLVTPFVPTSAVNKVSWWVTLKCIKERKTWILIPQEKNAIVDMWWEIASGTLCAVKNVHSSGKER